MEEAPAAGEITDAAEGDKKGGVAAPVASDENEEFVAGRTVGAADGIANGDAEGPFARRL